MTKYAADRLALQADVPPEQLKEMQEELQEALLRSEEKVKVSAGIMMSDRSDSWHKRRTI